MSTHQKEMYQYVLNRINETNEALAFYEEEGNVSKVEQLKFILEWLEPQLEALRFLYGKK